MNKSSCFGGTNNLEEPFGIAPVPLSLIADTFGSLKSSNKFERFPTSLSSAKASKQTFALVAIETVFFA